MIFGGIQSFLHPILLSWSVVFHYTFDPWNQTGWEKESSMTCIPPFYVICLTSSAWILARCTTLYTSITLMVIQGIWYHISRNKTRTISSIKVSTTRDITEKLCVYHLAPSFNWRTVGHSAKLIASYSAPRLNITILLRIYTPVTHHY